jgi:30S ribosomal protein 3
MLISDTCKYFMDNLKLQVLWLDSSLGLAVNQKTPTGIVPLTPYYFWPISEAWEQLRFELDAKPWFTENERVALLNSIVDIMNQWQQARTDSADGTTLQREILVSNDINVIGLP